jgi:predicted nucleic acid-binding protein
MARLRSPHEEDLRKAAGAGSRSGDQGAGTLLTVYADTSVLVSLYLPDAHSEDAQRSMAQRPRLWLTPLHRAEWTNAIAQHIFQRKISAREAQQLFRVFQQDREAALWIEADLPETVWEACVTLARRHVARLGVRTLDTLHVASALELKAESFWSFDQRQAKLAKAAGLKIL